MKKERIEPAVLKVGPYFVSQKVTLVEKGPKGGPEYVPEEGVWVLPGGRNVSTTELSRIAAKNNWKLG